MKNQQTQTYPTDDHDYFLQRKYVQNNTPATTPNPQIKTTEIQDNAQTEEDSFNITPEGKENLLNT